MKKSTFPLVSLLLVILTFPGIAAADTILPGIPTDHPIIVKNDFEELSC